ncbi:TonB-dependent receptor [Lunatimonas salinarum]|uniref:TonB-dependent receptor n=1 Tax=Lunatimonas salinarum TaxID=1774590 RepID=UPI001FD85036|nr:TonB-dependent receptor [Lunatimonas salinarum]
MNRLIKKLFITSFGVVSPFLLNAQETTPGAERGEIRDTEFIIRKDRVLTLPTQNRINERPPALPSVGSQGNYTYAVKDFFLDMAPVTVAIQPFARNFPKPPVDAYHSFTRLGYGNFRSPLAEIHLNNLPDDEHTFGVKLKHQGFYRGPVDGASSAEDHTEVKLNGSLFREDLEIFGDFGYDRDKYHFYGYSEGSLSSNEPFDLAQVLHTAYGRVGIRKVEQLDVFNYQATLNLRLFNDNYLAREHEASLQAMVGFRANENLHGGINTQLFFTSPSDERYTGINRNYFKLQPFAVYQKAGIHFKVGANVIHENDVVPNKTKDFHVYPLADISYHPVQSFGVYASYKGDVLRKTYYDFVRENPFLGPSEQLRNTIQNYEVDLGVSGKILDEMHYKAGVKYGNFSNMHFFGNSAVDSTRFQLIYDEVSQVLNYHIAAEWNFEGMYKVDGEINYYQYTLTDLTSPWHRPEWEVKVHNTFQPDSKWTIQFNAHLMGGISAINLESDVSTTLKPILDVQAKFDYRITPRFSVFAIGNNLLNQSNQRFWNYPVRGIQGIGGITMKF